MRKIVAFLATAAALVSSCCSVPKVESSLPYKIKGGTIVFDEPSRESGQVSALRLSADPIDTIRVGLVGCGSRARTALDLLYLPGVQIVALCDKYEEHVDKYLAKDKILNDNSGIVPRKYVGEEAYKEMCESDDIDLVYVTTGWQMHVPVSLYALRHGKHVACEVPAATTLEECWALVDACEQTRKHFFMLENCIYDKEELFIHNLVRQGLLGEVYYGAGAYIHNLDRGWERYTDNWRLDFNQKRRGDNYATHGLGPICRDMDIHRGDRLETLISMDSAPLRSKEWGQKLMGTEEFAEGDQTVTLIRTAKGHLIEIQHNVYGRSPYSRIHEVMGTAGWARKYPSLMVNLAEGGGPVDSLMTLYNHPVYAEVEQMAEKVGGHGGMDFVMLSRLVYCLHNGLPLDMDVYDAAEWSCIGELSGVSMDSGYLPVRFPDFTRGDWALSDHVSFEYKF